MIATEMANVSPIPSPVEDNSVVLGKGGEADSEDDQSEEATGDRADLDEDDFENDAHATMAESSQPAVDAKALVDRIAGPCVVAGEMDARRNSVDADVGDAQAQRAADAPARVGPKIDDALAQLPRVLLKMSGQSWDWVKLDMLLAQHGVVHDGEDGTTPIQVDMALLKRSGSMLTKQQNTFLASATNGSRMIAQAIILPIESRARPTPSPKMMIVPVSITDLPAKDAGDLEGATTVMALEPDIVKKMYNRDSIAARSLSTSTPTSSTTFRL